MSCHLLDPCDQRGQQAEDKSEWCRLSHRAFGCQHTCACEYRLEISLDLILKKKSKAEILHFSTVSSIIKVYFLFPKTHLTKMWHSQQFFFFFFDFQTMTLGTIVFKRISKRMS